jgi:hypothetical protein
MNQQELLEQLKSVLNSSEKAIIEIQKGVNIDFYAALIQNNSIECFNLSKQLADLKSIPSVVEIKIESVKAPEPVIKESTTIPEIQNIKKEEEKAPVIETVIEPIQEILKPIVEEVKTEIKTEELVIKETVVPKTEKVIETTPKAVEKAAISKPSTVKVEVQEDEISLNDKLSKNKTPVLNFADKSTETAISDLSKAISIGKKFEFINGLFGGNSELYKNCIQTLQNSENFEKAINYIENEITSQFDWNDEENENLAAEFFALIKRRFN